MKPKYSTLFFFINFLNIALCNIVQFDKGGFGLHPDTLYVKARYVFGESDVQNKTVSFDLRFKVNKNQIKYAEDVIQIYIVIGKK